MKQRQGIQVDEEENYGAMLNQMKPKPPSSISKQDHKQRQQEGGFGNDGIPIPNFDRPESQQRPAHQRIGSKQPASPISVPTN